MEIVLIKSNVALAVKAKIFIRLDKSADKID